MIDGLHALRERLHERQQKLEDLQRAVDVALEQSKLGPTMVFDDTIVEDVKASGRERLKAKGVPSA